MNVIIIILIKKKKKKKKGQDTNRQLFMSLGLDFKSVFFLSVCKVYLDIAVLFVCLLGKDKVSCHVRLGIVL